MSAVTERVQKIQVRGFDIRAVATPAGISCKWPRKDVAMSADGMCFNHDIYQTDDSIPVRANKKKGLKSKKELREEVRAASLSMFRPALLQTVWMRRMSVEMSFCSLHTSGAEAFVSYVS